jgi:hypothetical protein
MLFGSVNAWRTLSGFLLACLLSTPTLLAQTDNPARPAKRKLLPPANRLLADRSEQAAATNGPLPAPMITRHTRLHIPFAVNQSAQQATEVQLYVSVNQGRDWEIYARQQAARGQFDFRAPREGSYWFCSRTMDAQQKLWPQGEKKPELILVVDVTQPQLQLASTSLPDGRVQLQWTIQDANLQLESFQISGQAAGDLHWEPIPHAPLAATRTVDSYQGKTDWQPATAAPVLMIQASVRDQAGNRTEIRRRLAVSEPTTKKPPAPVIPDLDRQPATSKPATSKPATPKTQLPAIPWPVDRAKPDPTATPPARFTNGPQRVTVTPSIPLLPDRSPFDRPAGSPPPKDPSRRLPTAAKDETVKLPPGTIVQSSNSRYFQLDYDVQKAGGKGPPEIQLWATADGGQSWQQWGTDEDRQSPFQVQVRFEGIFGFRIAVVGQNGLARRQPIQGDPADIWLRVDTTAPEARIQSASFGAGSQAGNLVIRWQADDLALAQRPISLYYREKSTEKWTTIASGLENSGTYAWPVSPLVPDAIHLRLDAQDQAGNIGSYQHPTPITLLGLAPESRIRAIQPLAAPADAPLP